jgi:Asp-tRNA(Asn)/Glu-tRNA(Gln) amidotransferase B subunit
MYESGRTAEDLVRAEGLAQIDDRGALLAAIRGVLEQHADAVGQYRAGKSNALGFLVGQVMKTTGGKANPRLVNELLRAELDATTIG